MKVYLDLLKKVLECGERREDRTGTGTLSLFGHQMRFDLSDGFPLITTKKLHLRSILHELLWFLDGKTNIKYLNEHNVTIWDEWANEKGEVGPIYGYQWRRWGGSQHGLETKEEKPIDQISQVVDSLKHNPYSRRHIVSAWNVSDLEKMALPPCHVMFQFYVHNNNRLSCQMYQRSADLFLGVPFNIASYALLTMMMAQVTNLVPGEFVHTFGDVHLYSNHLEQAQLQLSRQPLPLPTMKLNPNRKSILEFQYEDFVLENYSPYPHIKAEISI